MKNQLLLLHGALGSGQQLEPLKKRLEDDFDVRVHTFTGHGGQPILQSYSLESLTEDLRIVIEGMRGPLGVFGYSMGGYVAMNYARMYPGVIHKIMTLGTKFAWSPEVAAKEVNMLDSEKIVEKVPAFAETLRVRHAPTDWKLVLRETASMMKGLGSGDSIAPEAWGLDIPILVTRAEFDHMVSQGESQEVVQHLKHAFYRELPGSKHPIEQVDFDLLADRMRSFFS